MHYTLIVNTLQPTTNKYKKTTYYKKNSETQLIENTSSPLAIEQYNSMDSSNIRGSGYSIQNLVTRQLDRINFLLTLGTAKITQEQQYFNETQMLYSVKRGLRTVESFLSPYIKNDKEYLEGTDKIKQRITTAISANKPTQAFDELAEWYDALISRLGNLDMLPQKSADIEFD
jgi:hypothetical protein